MRNKFAQCLTEIAAEQQDVCLLYADIGNRLFDKLKDVAPERTINAGIAEANMATMASGMATMGLRPFIYTITPFTTARNFEQIKIDLAYADVPVVIVGTGSGLSYANLGPTHHSFEDIALMRILPNMQVVCPADSLELEALMPQMLTVEHPTYLRIGKKNEPLNYDSVPNIKLGKAHVLQEGQRVLLLCCGTALQIGGKLHAQLQEQGISTELTSMHTVKPLDEDYLQKMADYDLVVTLEEHSLIGGFGSAINDWIVDVYEQPVNLLRCGIPDKFIDQLHDPDSARKRIGLTAEDILPKILQRLSKK
ncbi:transketolase [Paraneptunicella aestuarii]|uniref:transketolase family protein n=1 Tax=Paraneptunicella aestuarii TaxID=2831148 RepID=UPI001E602DE4|nr:transketolase C-terminal domain-containing protein [Paraneptunicella aestuarii]UAA39522.1 transketolase [Paraneptunicella aestuarii]